MNFSKLLQSLIFSIPLFTPFILIIISWVFFVAEEYKTAELATLIFTISLFMILFIFEKIGTESKESFKDKNLSFIDKQIRDKHIIDIVIIFSIIPISIISIPIILFFLLFIIIKFILTVLNIMYNYLFMVKYYRYIETDNQENIDFLENFIVKEDKWKDIISPFTEHHKKSSLSLIKKNKLTDEFKLPEIKIDLMSIFKLKYFIGVLQTLQEVLLDIKVEEDISIRLSKLIFKVKLLQYKISFMVAFSFLKQLFIFTLILSIFSWVLYLIDFIDLIEKIIYKDILYFILGFTLLISVIPLSYIYFTFIKFYNLKPHNKRHNSWFVFIKNIFTYISTFSLSLILVGLSIHILSVSGLEYNSALHFLSTMILPTFTLQDIPNMMAHRFGDDVIFGIFVIKILFLIFMFSLGVLLIKQFIEIYIEKSDILKDNIYSIPSEFVRFFSYLVLSVLIIILFYGTLFINYPSLQKEYDSCKEYLKPSQVYLQDTNISNSITGKYCSDLKRNENNYIKDKNSTKYTSLYIDCENYLNYDNDFSFTDINYIKYDNNHSLGANHCPILMKYYVDKNSSLKSQKYKSNRSFADYLPLSIFFTLFGVITMIASRNLLENYFTGLSLKIDTHYEEGERVRVDGGEMMMVKDVGFRATTFYGISTNTKIVIPHQELSKSTIVNYTKPTLDYREKITIYVPDRHKHSRNIPKEAEKILLLAAFIATGVKKPRLKLKNTNIDNKLKIYIQEFDKHLNKFLKIKIKNEKYIDKSKIIIEKKEIEEKSKSKQMDDLISECEEYKKDKHIINKIWKLLEEENENARENEENRDGIKKYRTKEIFLYQIFRLIKQIDSDSSEERKEKILVIKKIFASIIKALYDYEIEAGDNLHHSVDDYCMKRKINTLYKYDEKDNLTKKERDDLKDISKHLVNISYYYFMLSKQIWELKSIDKSEQQKNNYDEASLEILDVPRVTSSHHRDYEGAFWEVNLLVTVELGEQSDEVIHHINMYIDDLWDIFDLPSRCNNEIDTQSTNKIYIMRDRNRRKGRR
jgi:hypothetical protein